MNESLIQQNGSLKVPSSEVTWFQFLELARLANSTQGGWNSRTYWRQWGLDVFREHGRGFISIWTRNSLEPKALPTPRTKDFCMPRKAGHTLERTAVISQAADKIETESPDGVAEVYLNARLFDLRSKDAGHQWGQIVGYEIPLCAERDGQLRVDLFAKGEKFVTLIELKQGNGADSPLLAVAEAICYGLQLIRCKEAFCAELNETSGAERSKIGEEHIKTIRLVIAAPAQYWTNWGCPGDDRKLQADDSVLALIEVVKLVNSVTVGSPWETNLSIIFHRLTSLDLRLDPA